MWSSACNGPDRCANSKVVLQRDEFCYTPHIVEDREHVPHVAVQSDVLEKVAAPKDAVVLHHPQVFIADKRLQVSRRNIWLIERTESVASVVQKCADHVLVVSPVHERQGGGLQTVVTAVNREPPKVTVQEVQVGQHAAGQSAGHFDGFRNDPVQAFLGAFFDTGKSGAGIHGVSSTIERCANVLTQTDPGMRGVG